MVSVLAKVSQKGTIRGLGTTVMVSIWVKVAVFVYYRTNARHEPNALLAPLPSWPWRPTMSYMGTHTRRPADLMRGQEVNDENLTAQERKAISDLKSLAKRWPRSLTLFSNSGTLEVHRTQEYLKDPVASPPAADIYGIPNDGGDRT
jgi:hypothetical protein